MTTPDTLMDLITNLFPPNLIQATMQQYRYRQLSADIKMKNHANKFSVVSPERLKVFIHVMIFLLSLWNMQLFLLIVTIK